MLGGGDRSTESFGQTERPESTMTFFSLVELAPLGSTTLPDALYVWLAARTALLSRKGATGYTWLTLQGPEEVFPSPKSKKKLSGSPSGSVLLHASNTMVSGPCPCGGSGLVVSTMNGGWFAFAGVVVVGSVVVVGAIVVVVLTPATIVVVVGPLLFLATPPALPPAAAPAPTM